MGAAQALGQDHQIGGDAFRFDGVQRAAAAHATHHLVEDEQHAVAVADFADALEVSRCGLDRAQRCTDDCFGDEGDDVFGTQLDDLCIELVGHASAVEFRCLVRPLAAIRVTRRDVLARRENRREHSTPPRVAADGQRTQRVAVIALPPGDEVPSVRLAALDEILSRQLERCLDAFRAAGYEVHVRHFARSMGDELVAQRFGGVGREKARVCVFQPVELAAHRRQHGGMTVAEARHRGAAAGVEIAVPALVDKVDPLAADRSRIILAKRAMQDMACRAALEGVVHGLPLATRARLRAPRLASR